MPSILEDKDAIRDLFARYCFYTDSGQFEKYVALFTEDCDWDGGSFGRCQGREALLAYLKAGGDASKNLRHSTTNMVIEVQGDSATATSYVQVLGVEGQAPVIFFAGIYLDRLVRRDGRWLFAQRRIRTDFADALPA
ncbi:MAG: nuclear transport factor 2 family protein [Gammaproteobacteria bacterium]